MKAVAQKINVYGSEHWSCKAVIDSFARLSKIETGAYDVTITDPPFSAHVHANLCSGSLVGKKSVPKYELAFAALNDYAWAKELVRVTKRWVLVCCSVEDFGRFEAAVGRPDYVRSGIWYKPNAMGQLTADRPATSYEGVAIMHCPTRKKKWNGKGSYGIWKCNGTRGKKDRHPNEKPLDLAMKWTALFSDRGETVFDPFCGSGAFGEAALLLGRNYVGWDNELSWVKRASERCAATVFDSCGDEAALALCRMKDVV
jgi:site-specific DNA-methyltransferase (adenine-specific)